ncbi:MAG: hypothetical protein O3A01_06970 [bacterium]|nr:hypothetical protein [bacterium]
MSTGSLKRILGQGLCLALMGVLIFALPGHALRIELSNEIFNPTGRGSNRNLFVTNNTDKMMAAEIYAKRRSINPLTGADILVDEENFLIYPNQLLLQPGEQQVSTVTWLGEKNPAEELSFRIVVEQLNLDLGEQSGNQNNDSITVEFTALTKIVKAAYVTPSDASPKLVVKSAEAKLINGKKMMVVELQNIGTAHQIVRDLKLSAIPLDALGKDAGKAIDFSDTEFNGAFNMLSSGSRVFTVPWPKQLTYGAVKVRPIF